MFIGHYALGLAAKRLEPRLPLATLLAAPQLLDLLWPLFVLAHIEQVEVAPGDTAFTPLRFVSYPWSHSLVMSILWGASLGVIGTGALVDTALGILDRKASAGTRGSSRDRVMGLRARPASWLRRGAKE